MAGVSRLGLTVEFEDGTVCQVMADQRDIVIFEREMKVGYVNAIESMPITMFRRLAFDALRRTGLLPATVKNRAQFEDTCIGVEPEDEDVTANPGLPEASEGNSSSSPARRVPASGNSRVARTGNPKT